MRGEADDEARIASTVADAARLTGARCPGCGTAICGHAAVFSLVLGYKNRPRCLPCIAAHMREGLESLRDRTLAYVQHHECYLAAWDRAGELEGFGPTARPACLWDAKALDVGPERESDGELGPGRAAQTASAAWDAGDLGCGDLVLELRLRLRDLAPGALFELRATDPGAPIDLPAWCGLTGHALVSAKHPVYRIRRKA